MIREAGGGPWSLDDAIELRRAEMDSGTFIPFDELPAPICSMLEASNYGAAYWDKPSPERDFESPLAAAAKLTSSRGAYASQKAMKALVTEHELPFTPRKREGAREALDELGDKVHKRPKLATETDGKYWGSALAKASTSQRQTFDEVYNVCPIKQSVLDGGASPLLALTRPAYAPPSHSSLRPHPPRPASHAHAHTPCRLLTHPLESRLAHVRLPHLFEGREGGTSSLSLEPRPRPRPALAPPSNGIAASSRASPCIHTPTPTRPALPRPRPALHGLGWLIEAIEACLR